MNSYIRAVLNKHDKPWRQRDQVAWQCLKNIVRKHARLFNNYNVLFNDFLCTATKLNVN